jgi:hypothetical protein
LSRGWPVTGCFYRALRLWGKAPYLAANASVAG